MTPVAKAGGIDVAMNVGDSPLTMRNSIISGNKLFSIAGTTADTGAAGNALELDGGGIISNTSITDNTTTIVSPGGVAGNAGAGLVMLNFNNDARLVTVIGGAISGNTAIAKTAAGQPPARARESSTTASLPSKASRSAATPVRLSVRRAWHRAPGSGMAPIFLGRRFSLHWKTP